MRFVVVLNEDGGTLRTTDLDAFSHHIEKTLTASGHEVEIERVPGKDIVATLEKVSQRRNIDVVLAGGGDGTISAAAACLINKKKALAVLPAGTMNLFARSLEIPLNINRSIEQFADGKIVSVDIATANGRPFVHQFSIGMHAKMVQLREKMEFHSRWSKIRASAKAMYATLMQPPSMKVKLRIGGAEVEAKTTGIGVTNNLFGEGTLPYASDPAGGTLGVYVTVAQRKTELVRFFANMARGKWRNNEHVEIHETSNATLTIVSKRFRRKCVIDGELLTLDRKTEFRILPGALNVLVPAGTAMAKAPKLKKPAAKVDA